MKWWQNWKLRNLKIKCNMEGFIRRTTYRASEELEIP